MKCNNCGVENLNGNYCTNCGYDKTQSYEVISLKNQNGSFCGMCGNKIRKNTNYCVECGNLLTEEL